MTQGAFLSEYLKHGRKLMLRWMPPNSCIHASRATVECLRLMGIEARLQPVKWVVEWTEKKVAYVSGLTDEEMSQAESYKPGPYTSGWRGHLVVLAPGPGLMIDASFDQAFTSLGIPAFPQMFNIGHPKFRKPGPSLKLESKVRLETPQGAGVELRLQYLFTDDYSFLETDAWNDEGIPLLARAIVGQLGGHLRA